MADNSNKPIRLFSGLFIGAILGAITALLMAPQSGERTRRMIQRKSVELKDKTADSVDDSMERAEQALDDLRYRVNRLSGKAKKEADEFVRRGEKELQKQRERLEKIRV